MPASSGAQPAAKFSSSPAPSQGIIDDRQELRRCEYVALTSFNSGGYWVWSPGAG